jgi:hypothetical protein
MRGAAEPKLRVVSDAPGERADDQPLVAPGVYRAVYVRHETVALKMYGGAPMVFCHFRIIDPGEAFGVVLYRCYRAKALKGNPGRGGAFVLGKRSELYLQACQLVAGRLRRDRVSLREAFGGRVLKVSVRTVENYYKVRRLTPALHYSVVVGVLDAETTEYGFAQFPYEKAVHLEQ